MFYRAELNGENFQLRDKYMAENISRFAKENQLLKIIIWAHNAHISTSEDYGAGMGRYLNSEYSIYSIGFSLGQGYFTGADLTNGGNLGSYPLQPPIEDSYESFFIQSKYPNFFLDLKGIKRVSGNEWLFESRKLRYIGAGIYGRYQFVKTNLTGNFDAIIFVKDSTPSHLLVK
jgi:erythromycin esterase-like protein